MARELQLGESEIVGFLKQNRIPGIGKVGQDYYVVVPSGEFGMNSMAPLIYEEVVHDDGYESELPLHETVVIYSATESQAMHIQSLIDQDLKAHPIKRIKRDIYNFFSQLSLGLGGIQ